MKKLLIVLGLSLGLVTSIYAGDSSVDDCTQMSEPCLPADLCAEPCDPIAD